MDFSQYKDRLLEYARLCGYEVNENKNTKCFLPTHTGKESQPSLKFYGDHFKCFGCDQAGDIYDLAGILHGITDKSDQYKDVEKVFGDSYNGKAAVNNGGKVSVKKKAKIIIDPDAAKIVTEYMRKQGQQNKDKIIEFAAVRGYGENFATKFGWWPGLDIAIKDIGVDVLKKSYIPVPDPDGEPYNGTAWKAAGCVLRFNRGWKLFYIKNGKTIKRHSYESSTFPYPVNLPDGNEIVLVEAEISSIAGNINDIKMLATGGTSGLNKDGAVILSKYETVVICFDAGEEKKSIIVAEKLVNGGYKGVIKIAHIEKTDFGKDPDDYIKSGHIKKLKEFLKDADIYETVDKDGIEWPFRFLGFSEHSHYFLDRKDMITKIPAGKMASGHLLEIAPMKFWKTIKLNKSKEYPDWPFIYDLVIDRSVTAGPYKKTSIRGTGVWQENNEIIASDGEFIICKTERIHIKDYKSKNTYIRRASIGIDSVYNNQHKKDFIFIENLIKDLSFSSEQDGRLLFGWIISSIFLSVIRWRPIVYMKGPSQVGKSWVMNNIVRNILDGIAVSPKKNSTVIGVMQAPGYDSRMTTVDEIETGTDKKTQELIKGLMTLARDTTTKSKESRYVGTQDQEGISSDFTSMFLFASIVESSEEDQDINRITSVSFYPKLQKNWAALESKILYEFNNGIGDRIRYNAIYHRESIVNNIYMFQKIAGAKSTKQRNGDQLGTLIAGWYHLENPGKTVSEDEASEYVERFDFTEQEERNKGERLKHILSSVLSYKIRYEEEGYSTDKFDNVSEYVKMRERPVYDILKELHDMDKDVTREPLNLALMAYGIRYGTVKNPEYMGIAQGHEKIRLMFPYNFPHKENYHGYLANHPDYRGKEKSGKFKGSNHMVLLFEVDFSDEENVKDIEDRALNNGNYSDSIPF